jgi:hypothetical protein
MHEMAQNISRRQRKQKRDAGGKKKKTKNKKKPKTKNKQQTMNKLVNAQRDFLISFFDLFIPLISPLLLDDGVQRVLFAPEATPARLASAVAHVLHAPALQAPSIRHTDRESEEQ